MNGELIFPVLRGGIAIHNPHCDPARPLGPYGTLGLIATDGTVRWLLSCYHVLCRINADMPGGIEEPIYQPFTNPIRKFEPAPVALVSAAKANRALDCAAARMISGSALGQILGIGKLTAATVPKVGMRVLKSGVETGVTEGIVSKIHAGEFEIAPGGFAEEYQLSEGGDSGSIWIDAATLAPVGLHFKGSDRGFPERAFAKPIKDVLGALDLQIVFD